MIEYFAQNLWLMWVLAGILCLILELMNGDFFIMCFAIGCVVSAVTSAFTDSLTVQIIVFAIITLLCLFFVRPVALRYFHRGEDTRVSNADALIGRKAVVADAIPADGYGYVKVDGDEWRAKSADGSAIASGSDVRIVKMESIIVTVVRI